MLPTKQAHRPAGSLFGLLIVSIGVLVAVYLRSGVADPQTFTEFQELHPSWESLNAELRRLRRPGAGWASVGSIEADDGRTYHLHEMELSGEPRVLVVLHQVLNEEYSQFRFVASFAMEVLEQDELVRPLRKISISGGWLRFSSGGREYKSHKLPIGKEDAT